MNSLQQSSLFKNLFTCGGLHFSSDAHSIEKIVFSTQNLPSNVFEMQFKQNKYPYDKPLTIEFDRMGEAMGIRDVLTLHHKSNLAADKTSINQYCLQMLNQMAIDTPTFLGNLFGNPIAIPLLSTGVIDDEQILLILQGGKSKKDIWSLDYLKAGKLLPKNCCVANLFVMPVPPLRQ